MNPDYIDDPERAALWQQFVQQSPQALEALKAAASETSWQHQREIALTCAMIEGLELAQPDGYQAKVAELEAHMQPHVTAMEQALTEYLVLTDVLEQSAA